LLIICQYKIHNSTHLSGQINKNANKYMQMYELFTIGDMFRFELMQMFLQKQDSQNVSIAFQSERILTPDVRNRIRIHYKAYI